MTRRQRASLLLVGTLAVVGCSSGAGAEAAAPKGGGAMTLTDLSPGEKNLKAAFNRDAGQVRLLLIVSPT